MQMYRTVLIELLVNIIWHIKNLKAFFRTSIEVLIYKLEQNS